MKSEKTKRVRFWKSGESVDQVRRMLLLLLNDIFTRELSNLRIIIGIIFKLNYGNIMSGLIVSAFKVCGHVPQS